MSDDRTGIRRPSEQQAQERMLQARTMRRSDTERDNRRQPEPAGRDEWRGSGVCGDCHTD